MNDLIYYLESIVSDDRRRDTGALAALRRGLGQPPGTCADMFPYVLPHLTEEQQQRHFAEYCLLASLFAYHPESAPKGSQDNLGNHMRNAGRDSTSEGGISEATERRFSTLLRAHPDDLPVHLRQAISFLKSKKEPVNWNQLLQDLLHWDNENMSVQKAWARGFWGYLKPEIMKPEESDETEKE
jgi:CRISPR system Cascade subunit CasB